MPSIRLCLRAMRKTGYVPCALLLLLFCAACQAPPTAPTTRPAAERAQAPLPAEAERYVVDPAASEVRILVYRGGPLAEFGHSHVIRADGLRGELHLAPDVLQSTFDLVIIPEAFVVDPPDARADEGEEFSSAVSREAADATRHNMLGPRVLDAARYPEITLRSVALSGSPRAPEATVRILLRDVARDVTVPLSVRQDARTMTVTGTFPLRQTEFGITPFTAMGGGLTVKDELRIRFHLVFRKES